MPRVRSALRVIAVSVLAVALLAACDKPAAKITVLGGGKVVTITPSTYCFSGNHCRTVAAGAIDFPELTVAADAKVLIDVPRSMSDNGWQATALGLDKKVLGSSGLIHHSHSYKVPSGVAGGAPFVVEVIQLRHGKPDGSTWSFLVKVSLTKS